MSQLRFRKDKNMHSPTSQKKPNQLLNNKIIEICLGHQRLVTPYIQAGKLTRCTHGTCSQLA